MSSDITLIKKLGKVSREGVVAYDLAGKQLLYCNEVLLSIFELPENVVYSDPEIFLRKVVPEDLDHLKLVTEKLFTQKHVSAAEFSIQVPGYCKHLCCDVMVVEENDLLLGLIRDITSQRNHDEFAIDFGAQKDTLLDMLTHNLSAPLLLSKDILGTLDARKTSEHLEKTLNFLKDNTQFCLDIISDFLRYEHKVSMRTSVHKVRFDAIDKIKVILEQIRAMNPNKLIRFSSEFEKLPVSIDGIKFFQIVHNILSNSVKFTPEDGVIELEVTQDEKTFTVRFSDNGIGITEDLQKFIFTEQVFVRQGLKGENSSGLGLNIAKKLTELLGGRIYFESAVNRGATFYLQLPKE